MRLSASFQFTYSGNGFEAGAAEAADAPASLAGFAELARATPARPPRATIPPVEASIRRRLKLVCSFILSPFLDIRPDRARAFRRSTVQQAGPIIEWLGISI